MKIKTINGREVKFFTINAFGKEFEVFVEKTEYRSNGALALCVNEWDEEYQILEPFGNLTVNLEGISEVMPLTHAFVKDYSENEGWALDLARQIGGRPTGDVADNGFVRVPLWDFSKIII